MSSSSNVFHSTSSFPLVLWQLDRSGPPRGLFRSCQGYSVHCRIFSVSFFPGSDMLLQSIMSMFSRVGKMGVIITPSRKIKIKIGKRKTNRTNWKLWKWWISRLFYFSSLFWEKKKQLCISFSISYFTFYIIQMHLHFQKIRSNRVVCRYWLFFIFKIKIKAKQEYIIILAKCDR